MNGQLIFGIAAVPAIVGLVEVCKDLGLPTRVAPALSVLFGITAALAQLAAGHWPWVQGAAIGVSLGLSASGLYSGAQAVIQHTGLSSISLGPAAQIPAAPAVQPNQRTSPAEPLPKA